MRLTHKNVIETLNSGIRMKLQFVPKTLCSLFIKTYNSREHEIYINYIISEDVLPSDLLNI